jgi:hypothetical protein
MLCFFKLANRKARKVLGLFVIDVGTSIDAEGAVNNAGFPSFNVGSKTTLRRVPC